MAGGMTQQPAKVPRPKLRAKSAAPTLKVTAPTVPTNGPTAEQPENEEDPVAQELEDARAYHSWVKQQKPRVREKELPAAEERLAKAEAADKQRKPPGERLQSALSRVSHRQTLADSAMEAEKAAEEALGAARKEAAQAQQKLVEAQQELAVAQQAHKVWGQDPDRDRASYAGNHMTPDQVQAMQELSAKYLGTEVGSLLLRAFPMAGLQPDHANREPHRRAASEGAATGGGADPPNKRKDPPSDRGERRSRSPRDPAGKQDPPKRKDLKKPDPEMKEVPVAEQMDT